MKKLPVELSTNRAENSEFDWNYFSMNALAINHLIWPCDLCILCQMNGLFQHIHTYYSISVLHVHVNNRLRSKAEQFVDCITIDFMQYLLPIAHMPHKIIGHHFEINTFILIPKIADNLMHESMNTIRSMFSEIFWNWSRIISVFGDAKNGSDDGTMLKEIKSIRISTKLNAIKCLKVTFKQWSFRSWSNIKSMRIRCYRFSCQHLQHVQFQLFFFFYQPLLLFSFLLFLVMKLYVTLEYTITHSTHGEYIA